MTSLSAQAASVRARAARHRALVAAIKLAAGCHDCGYRDHDEALQFDHVRGEKLFTIGPRMTFSWTRILTEIAKCEVRCANCHAIATRARRRAEAR